MVSKILTEIYTAWTETPELSGVSCYTLQAPQGKALPYAVVTVVTNPITYMTAGDRDEPLVQISIFTESAAEATSIASFARTHLKPASLQGFRPTSERLLLDSQHLFHSVLEFRSFA